MTYQDPYEAITSLEVLLRELIRATWGEEWLAKSGLDPAPLEMKRQQERGRRRGIHHSADLLNYTEFTELTRTILSDRHWSVFAPALGKKKYVETYFARLDGLRNPTMHSRVIYPFERDLISGMVGELSNMLITYRSQKGPDMQYYPVITRAYDSLGHDDSEIGTANGAFQVVTEKTLAIGDHLSLHVDAIDPAGRTLRWTACAMGMGGAFKRWLVESAEGTSVDIEWAVEGSDVGEWAGIYVTVAAESEYHRHDGIDDRRYFWYTVNPPIPARP